MISYNNGGTKLMKKILLALTMFLMLSIPVIIQAGFQLSNPNETGATGFYFPSDGSMAGGLTYTGLRLKHTAITFASLDIDGTLAQKIGENNNDTLAGLGFKVNFYIVPTKAGWNFLPNIGYTGLANMKDLKLPADLFKNLKGAIYGTLIQYKFTDLPIIE